MQINNKKNNNTQKQNDNQPQNPPEQQKTIINKKTDNLNNIKNPTKKKPQRNIKLFTVNNSNVEQSKNQSSDLLNKNALPFVNFSEKQIKTNVIASTNELENIRNKNDKNKIKNTSYNNKITNKTNKALDSFEKKDSQNDDNKSSNNRNSNNNNGNGEDNTLPKKNNKRITR